MTVLNNNGHDDGIYSYFDNSYSRVSTYSDPDLDGYNNFGPATGNFGDLVDDLSKKFTIRFVIDGPQYECFIDEFFFDVYNNDT